MKKLLFSLSMLVSSVALADIQVDMMLTHNDHVIMQDSKRMDESMISRMQEEADQAIESCDADCQNGVMMCTLRSIDSDSATFSVVVMKKNDSGKMTAIFEGIITAPWGRETTLEVPGKDGEQWMFSLTASKI